MYVNPPDPDGYIRMEFDIVVTNDLISAIYNAPLVGSVFNFLTWLGTKWISFKMVIASHILSFMGFSNFFIESVEYFTTADNKPALKIIVRQDISPLLILIIGVAVGAVVAFIASGVIRDITRSWAQVETTRALISVYNEYTSLTSTVLDYCKTQQDPAKCVNEIMSTLTPPSTMVNSVADALNKIQNENNQLKTLLYILIVGVIAVALFTLWRTGTLSRVAGAVSGVLSK
jgi:tetrahydromethanopterin S-methyltransferase subunit B